MKVLEPSIITVKANPTKTSESGSCSVRNISVALETALNPDSDISKTPSCPHKSKTTQIKHQFSQITVIKENKLKPR